VHECVTIWHSSIDDRRYRRVGTAGRADSGIKRLPPSEDTCYSPQQTKGNHHVHPKTPVCHSKHTNRWTFNRLDSQAGNRSIAILCWPHL